MELVIDNSAETEARAWLNAHKLETGLSWPKLGTLTDVHPNTISTFASGKYGGDNGKIAAQVLAYRDRNIVQAEIAGDALMVPDW